MFTVQLFGRDTVGSFFQRGLDASFLSCELAIEAAERAVANSGNGSMVTLTNYRISGVSGATVLDVGVYGSQRRALFSREEVAVERLDGRHGARACRAA
jgi:hypothetical protein